MKTDRKLCWVGADVLSQGMFQRRLDRADKLRQRNDTEKKRKDEMKQQTIHSDTIDLTFVEDLATSTGTDIIPTTTTLTTIVNRQDNADVSEIKKEQLRLLRRTRKTGQTLDLPHNFAGQTRNCKDHEKRQSFILSFLTAHVKGG